MSNRSFGVQVWKPLRKSGEHRRAGRGRSVEGGGIFPSEPRCAPALRELGRPARAVAQDLSPSLREVLILHPDDPETLSNLAESCVGQGELEQALGHYRRLVELCPQSAKAHTSLALTEERVGNLRAAADSYRRALALDPGSPEAHCQLAIVLRQLDALPEALRLSEHAVALDPARFETYNTLGIVLADMKNLVAASRGFPALFRP